MEQFHYLIPFVGLIYGLSAAALLTHLHKLIDQRALIHFHAVPLIWVGVCFLIIINGWWAFFDINDKVEMKHAGDLMLLSLMPMLTFLLCATVLPQTINSKGHSLWKHFLSNRKVFFTLSILYLLSIQFTVGVFLVEEFNLRMALSNGIGAIIFLVLMFIKNRWLHLVFASLFCLSLVSTLNSQALVN